MSYVPLNVHTRHSLGEGLSTVTGLVRGASRLGLPALALTDSLSAEAHPRFYREAREAGIQPLLGAEVRGISFLSPTPTRKETFRLVLIARNDVGYGNLLKVITLALAREQEGVRLTADDLYDHADGLIALSGGLLGEVAGRILRGRPDLADAVAACLKEIYGSEGFYIEAGRVHPGRDELVHDFQKRIGARNGIHLVASNPVRYLEREQSDAYDLLTAIGHEGTGLTPSAPPGPLLSSLPESRSLHLRSAEETAEIFRDLPEALLSCRRIADACQPLAGFENPARFWPAASELDLPPDNSGWQRFLRWAEGEVGRRYDSSARERALELLRREARAVEEAGTQAYWLLAGRLAQHLKESGHRLGPGRGITTASVLAYLAGFSEVDPLAWSLCHDVGRVRELGKEAWFRFDLSPKARDEAEQFLIESWGEERAAHLGTYETWTPRRLLKTLGGALEVPPAEVDEAIEAFGSWDTLPFRRALRFSKTLQRLYGGEASLRRLFDATMQLEGLPRHRSAMAGELVLAPGRASDRFVVRDAESSLPLIEVERSEVTRLGCWAFDLRSLHFLEIIEKAAAAAGIELPVPISEEEPLDEAIAEMLGSGDSTGVFRLESSVLSRACVELAPRRFGDLVTLIGFSLSGRRWEAFFDHAASSAAEDERAAGSASDRLGGVLDETRGVLLYEEQVEELLKSLADFDAEGARRFLEAVRGGEAGALAWANRTFAHGAANRGLSPQEGERLYHYFLREAGSTIPKAQAVALALLTHRSAFLKAHAYRPYLLELLNGQHGQVRRLNGYLHYVRSLGIPILRVDVGSSRVGFRWEERSLRPGFDVVRGMSREDAALLVSIRESEGEFLNLEDFLKRVHDGGLLTGGLVHLAEAGALDALWPNRAESVRAVKAVLKSDSKKGKAAAGAQQLALELPGSDPLSVDRYLTGQKDYGPGERARLEREALRVDLTEGIPEPSRSDPLRVTTAAALDRVREGTLVRVGGRISEVNRWKTRSGGRAARLLLDTGRGQLPLELRDAAYDRWIDDLHPRIEIDAYGVARRRGARTYVLVLHLLETGEGTGPRDKESSSAQSSESSLGGDTAESEPVAARPRPSSKRVADSVSPDTISAPEPPVPEVEEPPKPSTRLALKIPDRFADYERLIQLLEENQGYLSVMVKSGGVRRKAWAELESLKVEPTDDLLTTLQKILGEEGAVEIIKRKRMH